MLDPKTGQKTESEVLELLRARITYHTTKKELAEHFGMSPSNMSQILMGNRIIPDNILQDLGYRRVTVMVPIDELDQTDPI